MIIKSNQFVNDRELRVQRGVRLPAGDAQRFSELARELGLNDRRNANGFAEFARLALRYTADRVEAIRAGRRKDWKEQALRMLGVNPDDVFPE